MKQSDVPSEPVPVRYDEIREYRERGYIVGIMHLYDTSGNGRPFEFRVTGTEKDVLDFASEAVIHQLELHLLDEEEDPVYQLVEQVMEQRRAAWEALAEEQRAAIDQLIGGRDVDLAADVQRSGTRPGLGLLLSDKPLYYPPVFEPEMGQERLCEITPLDLDSDVEYYLQFRIHPTVSAGRRDIYAPTANSTDAGASLTCTHDADLYLTRGGVVRDESLNAAN